MSLFDGMSCGMIAIRNAGLKVNNYYAYEIDKYAIQTSLHNFPQIQQCGDVFNADFTQYEGIDYLIGGSPCFTKGHLVLTSEGYKDVSEIRVGDSVLTHKNRYQKVIRTNKRETETVNVKIDGYPIFTTTPEHPFYAIKSHAKPCIGMNGSLTYRFSENPKWIRAKNLTDSDWCGQFNVENQTMDEHEFGKNASRFLGEDMAKCNESSLCFDSDVAEFYSKIEIPEFVFNLLTDCKKEFIRGFYAFSHISGIWDEHIDDYVCFRTGSLKFALGFQRLVASVYHTLPKITKVSVVSGNIPIYYVSYLHDRFGMSGCINKDNSYCNTPFIWSRCRSVVPTGRQETVYNIEVENDNSYTVNNIIVHNCTYWSIAQATDKRETTASGVGWELFSQYVRALKEAKPKFFIYENNKSMAKPIYESISETFGFEPIMINSALVSAQNRQRYYWVGKREPDGSYSKVPVSQPEDRGILLKDVLDDVCGEGADKARTMLGSIGRTTEREFFRKHQNTMSLEPVADKPFPVSDTKHGKSHTLNACYGRVESEKWYERVYSDNAAKQQHDYIAQPVNIAENGKARTIKAQYFKNNMTNFCKHNGAFGTTGVAERIVTNITKEG